MLPILSRGSLGWPEASDLDREFGRLFRHMWGNGGDASAVGTASYPVNISEDDDSVFVEAELPGFMQDEIDITLEQGMLSISAERKEEKRPEKEGTPLLHERRFTRYHRAFTLPTPVDDQKVEAKLSDGVLHLTLPKKAEVKPRRIKVS